MGRLLKSCVAKEPSMCAVASLPLPMLVSTFGILVRVASCYDASLLAGVVCASNSRLCLVSLW